MAYARHDLTGQKLGRLTGIEMTNIHPTKGAIWRLRCECGNIIERSASDLLKADRNGVNQSCTRSCSQTMDISGKTFGYLTAISIDHKTERGWWWKFNCVCGKQAIKNGSQVARGQGALHCGCKSFQGGSGFIDMGGKTFGHLTVIEQADSTITGQTVWRCKCTCDNMILVKGYRLRQGKTHCGCQRKTGWDNHSFRGYKEIHRSYWTSIQRGAISRKFLFEITIEQAWNVFEKQHGLCALSGMPLVMSQTRGQMTASLDRIDSTRGYVLDNIQWVHKMVNRIKMDIPEHEFIKWCGRIHDYTVK